MITRLTSHLIDALIAYGVAILVTIVQKGSKP